MSGYDILKCVKYLSKVVSSIGENLPQTEGGSRVVADPPRDNFTTLPNPALCQPPHFTSP